MPLKIRRRRDTGALRKSTGQSGRRARKTGVRVRDAREGNLTTQLLQEKGSDPPGAREILRTFHLGQRPDVRSFAEAYRSYLTFQPRSVRTIKTAFRVLRHFGGMGLDQINQEAVDKARGYVP